MDGFDSFFSVFVEKWGQNIQQALISHANMGSMYMALEMEDGGHPYEYMDTPWDFFEPLKI